MIVGHYLADQNLGRDRSRGITTYTVSLLSALSRRDDVDLVLLTSKSACRPENVRAELRSLPFRTDNSLSRLLADHMHPAWKAGPVDVWHYPKGYLSSLLRPRGAVVGTMHDTYILYYADHYPQYRSRWDLTYWLHMLRSSIARCDEVITDSECSKRALQEFCERFSITCPPLTVIYLAAEWDESPKLPKKADYVLHLASPDPLKQTSRVLDYWSKLRQKATLPKLRLIGHLSDVQSEMLAKLNEVVLSPPLSREELRGCMREARALILPSEIEGFGLPALEAYDAMTPVTYVRSTAVEEVLGACTPGGFRLSDFDSFTDALTDVLNLTENEVSATRNRLIAQYSWDKCASETMDVYRRAAI